MIELTRGLAEAIFDCVAPIRCADCAAPTSSGAALCLDCVRDLHWWRRVDGCPLCGGRVHGEPTLPAAETPIGVDSPGATSEACSGCFARGSALHTCYALLQYRGSPRRWLPHFKHARSLFGPPAIAHRLIDMWSREIALQVIQRTTSRPDLVVPIPLHPERQRERGFNQARSIADSIARTLEARVAPGVLLRIRDTPTQARRNAASRRANLRGAFRATPLPAGASRIWLVDDVLTTGSTLEAAADALLDAGAEEVRAITLAATRPSRRARPPGPAYHPSASNGDGRRRVEPV